MSGEILVLDDKLICQFVNCWFLLWAP